MAFGCILWGAMTAGIGLSQTLGQVIFALGWHASSWTQLCHLCMLRDINTSLHILHCTTFCWAL